jgi:chemotaxis protein MotB
MRKATGIAAGLQSQAGSGPPTIEEAKRVAEQAEHRQLESLMEELRKAIEKSQALQPFKDQLLLDITPEGLRIQIVDAQNRPMFDLGSAKLKGYTAAILKELTSYLNSVPNRISLTGHTDTTPYIAKNGYNNWDLSADRANAARRSLEAGGMKADKVARVVGLSSAVLFDKENPRNPINRRISIIVMTKQAEESAMRTDSRDAGKAEADAAIGATAPLPGEAPVAAAALKSPAGPELSDDPAVTAALKAVSDKPVK